MEPVRRYHKRSITTVFTTVVILVFIVACSGNKQELTSSISNRATTPCLRALDISTFISDSGITRYHITAQEWEIYDRAEEPYWIFPHGLHFDRLDPSLNVDAQIDCGKAVYWNRKNLWRLTDSVCCVNMQGERFETNLLYWDQQNEHIYSDSLITIYKQHLKLVGMGFESNQTLTNYRILQPHGVIPIDNDDNEADTSDNTTVPTGHFNPTQPPQP